MTSRNTNTRIQKLKKYNDDLSFDMQLFCLNPAKDKFLEISTNRHLAQCEGYDAWVSAALYKYNMNWDLDILTRISFEDLDAKLCAAVMSIPSRNTAIQLIHIFFATGELKYIDAYYQCMGHIQLPRTTREELSRLYHTVKTKYRERILELGADHFRNLDLRMNVIDFSYFDDAVERAMAEKEHNKLLNTMK